MLLLPAILVGGAGGSADALADLPEGSYYTPEGHLAIPLRAETPPFYTSEMHAKVVAAAEDGMAYDIVNDRPVPLAMQFLYIRPGTMMWAPAICTMNFIYGTPGEYQIGTAGHCVNRGQDVVLLLANPGILLNVGKATTSVNGGIGNDYALIDIRSNLQQYVDPNVAVVFGPQGGAWTGQVRSPGYQPVKHFGHGLGIGTGGTPRSGVMVWSDERAFYMDSPSINGYSGSAVLTSVLTTSPAVGAPYPLGQAVGVLTHLVVTGPGLSVVAGTRATVVPATVVDGDVNPFP